MQLQISLIERKPGKEIPESSKLEFLEKFSANDFALSDAEGNTSGPLNRGGIAYLPLTLWTPTQQFKKIVQENTMP